MIKTTRALGVFLLLILTSGCADSPASLTHEILVFWNEVCDNTLRVTDDDSAQKVLSGPLKRLDKKREDLRDRADKRMKAVERREQAVEVEDALVDAYYEIVATEKRVTNCVKRLKEMSDKNVPNNNSIVGVMKWIEEKRDFNSLSFGTASYTPDPRELKPKPGRGLLLPWPKMTSPTPQVQDPPDPK